MTPERHHWIHCHNCTAIAIIKIESTFNLIKSFTTAWSVQIRTTNNSVFGHFSRSAPLTSYVYFERLHTFANLQLWRHINYSKSLWKQINFKIYILKLYDRINSYWRTFQELWGYPTLCGYLLLWDVASNYAYPTFYWQ